MNMRYFLVLTVLLFSWAGLKAQPVQIKSAKITFEFPSKKVKGTLDGFASSSKIYWDDYSNSIFKGSVDAATLDTNNGLRNWSLRGSRYFNVKEYPKMLFVSKTIKKEGNTWLVIGDLTIKGVQKEFRIRFQRKDDFLFGTGELYSSDYGIKIKKLREENLVVVNFEFEFVP